MKKPKILVLCSTYPRWPGDIMPGFVENLCIQLSHSFEIHILAPHFPGAKKCETSNFMIIHRFRYAPNLIEKLAYGGGILENIKNNPITLLLIPVFLITQFLHLNRLYKKHKYPVIHAHWIIPQGLIVTLFRLLTSARCKTLITSHGGDLYSYPKGPLEPLRRWVLSNADMVTVVSDAMKQRCSDLNVALKAIDVVPMGVDLTTTFVPDAKYVRNPKAIVFVGRLVEKKGVCFLILAVSNLVNLFPNIKLTIIGDGPLRKDLENLTISLNLRNNIIFTGGIHNLKLPTYLQSSGIAVIPSIQAASGDQEGLGLTIVEAMGCGCAVVASSLPAIHDLIIDGKTGLLSTPGDSGDLTNKISELLENPTIAIELANNGRKHVLDTYDWGKIGFRYTTIIKRLAT